VFNPLLAFGGKARGERLRRMSASPQYRDGAFHNKAYDPPMPAAGTMRREWRERGQRRPPHTIPVLTPDLGAIDPDRLSVVWLGHATCLLEIEGRRVLLDPVVPAEGVQALAAPEPPTDILLTNRFATAKFGWEPRWYSPSLERWTSHSMPMPCAIAAAKALGEFSGRPGPCKPRWA